MKFRKAWWLALGVTLGSNAIPAAYAQTQVGRQSEDQSQPGSKANNDQSSEQKPASGDKRAKWSSSKNQNGSGIVQFGDAQGQNWSYILGGNGQRWNLGPASRGELDLAAADDSVREHLNLPVGQGIVVNWVAPTSGAAQAGIEENDVLLMVGESPLGKPEDLYDRLKEAGEKPLPLTLLRSGSKITLQVQPLIRVTLRPVTATAPSREYWIGVSAIPLESVLRAQLRLSPDHKVIVNKVFPGSPAAKAGVALHDIIVAIDGRPVSDPSDVAKSVQAKGEKALVLELIGKGGKSRTVPLTPERKKATETLQDATRLLGNPLSNGVTLDIVRPGVLLKNMNAIGSSNQTGQWVDDLLTQIPGMSDSNQKSQDATQALTKRLDALEPELKKLLKLVEELQKVTTEMVEQKKSSAK